MFVNRSYYVIYINLKYYSTNILRYSLKDLKIYLFNWYII